MTEGRTVPELHLDPDGRPLVVFDLQGDPRDLTVWGAVTAGPAVALIATDTDDPPTAGEAMALADALNPERVALLAAARDLAQQRLDENDRLRAERDQLQARVRAEVAAHERLTGDLRHFRQMHETQVQTIRDQRAELGVLREHAEALRADTLAARSVGRDVARLAVIALSRSPKSTRRLRGVITRRDTP